MAELNTIADYADRLRVVREHRDRLVMENARIPRLEGRVQTAEKKKREAEARVEGLDADVAAARKQLDAAKVEIRNLNTQLQGQQNELEELRRFKSAVSLVTA